jgi:hypothetical protein
MTSFQCASGCPVENNTNMLNKHIRLRHTHPSSLSIPEYAKKNKLFRFTFPANSDTTSAEQRMNSNLIAEKQTLGPNEPLFHEGYETVQKAFVRWKEIDPLDGKTLVYMAANIAVNDLFPDASEQAAREEKRVLLRNGELPNLRIPSQALEKAKTTLQTMKEKAQDDASVRQDLNVIIQNTLDTGTRYGTGLLAKLQ